MSALLIKVHGLDDGNVSQYIFALTLTSDPQTPGVMNLDHRHILLLMRSDMTLTLNIRVYVVG